MTVAELIHAAFRLVINKSDTPTDQEYADGLEALQVMQGQWKTKDYLAYIPYSSKDSKVLHPPEYLSPLKYNLAIEIAGEYGVEPSSVVVARAKSGLANLRNKAAMPVQKLETKIFNESFTGIGSYNINTDGGS